MLIQHLRQLEADALVIREAKPVVPPYVTYSLSPSGCRLKPVLQAMATWGIEERQQDPETAYANLEMFPY